MPIFVIMEQNDKHKWKRGGPSSIIKDEAVMKAQLKEEFKKRIVPAKIAEALKHGNADDKRNALKGPLPSLPAAAVLPPKGDTGFAESLKISGKQGTCKKKQKTIPRKSRKIPKFNGKHKRFCEEYIIDHNQTKAAIRAGYSEKSAVKYAAELMTFPDIVEYIAKLEEEATEKAGVQAVKILNELQIIGHSNIKDYVTVENGNVLIKDFKEIPDDLAKAIESVKETRDGIAIKLYSKTAALELLGQHKSLFVQKIDLTEHKPVIFDGEDKIKE